MLIHDPDGAVLLVGGYGVVGAELARLLHAQHPDLPLILAGRNPDPDAPLAASIGAGVIRWNLPDPAPDVAVRAVVTVVNDLDDAVLRACLAAGVRYVDITRWTARLHAALAVLAAEPPRAAVVLSSGWMGGLVPRMVSWLSPEVGGATDVDIAVRYDIKDRAGVDSVEFMDRLGQVFPTASATGERLVTPLTEVRRVDIGGDRVRVGRIDTPEQFTLPLTVGLQHCATRIGFSDDATTLALLALRRIGFFRIARGDRWRGLRQSLMYRPGSGGEARLRIDLEGPTGRLTATLSDPAGQAHLTAVGALLSLRDALATSGGSVRFPERSDTSMLQDQLRDLGVLLIVDGDPARSLPAAA